ncbi:MAG: SAP domain-containing protein [Sulfurimicrobium sp.]|jgi:hypothetical protein|nr:SAP domain-containing protein [Sulfurimicrobium sp.]MDP2963776.1 SAP domain-containing protein [Sulfurimicrobium sp.]MDZ7657639.1 SAP domain-containing protein [Sulfurimicrobium sp.]
MMKIQDIRSIARGLKLKSSASSKVELIRQIQRHEGNFDCYATALLGICDQTECLWRKDCLAAASQ